MEDKIIEEMAEDLKTYLPNNWYWQKTVDTDTYFVARALYNLGYRKIPENSVVISQKEYKENLSLQYDIGYEVGSKETAEKIYTFVNSFGTHNWERFKEFIKQFGVEVKE